MWWLVAAASGDGRLRRGAGFLGSWLGLLLLFGWTFSLFFHLCNGIRHLVWDAGWGFELQDRLCRGWTVVAASAALTLIAWIAGLVRAGAAMSEPRHALAARAARSASARPRKGSQHWWAQRVTAVALVPLMLWFVAALIAPARRRPRRRARWLRPRRCRRSLMVLLLVAVFYHMALGLQVVIEDYVHAEGREARPRWSLDPALLRRARRRRRSSPCCASRSGG